MLKARKNLWFEKIFSVYNRHLIGRRFDSLRVHGMHYLRLREHPAPLIVYANHSSWWDGLVLFEILSGAGLDNFVMMEEKQLKQWPLFRRLGAFSVIRDNPRDAVKSLEFAVQTLVAKPNRSLLIFPQGEIRPNDQRPLRFYHGISRIVEKLGVCQTVPCAVRYEFRNNFKPEIFLKIGKISLSENIPELDPKKLTGKFEDELTGLLDDLKNNILTNNFDGFEKIV